MRIRTKLTAALLSLVAALIVSLCPLPAFADETVASTSERRGVEMLAAVQPADRELVSTIREAMETRKSQVKLGRAYDRDEVLAAVLYINNVEPLFYDVHTVLYTYEDGSVDRVEFEYPFDNDEFAEAERRYEQAVAEALKWTSSTMSAMDNCKALCDYLVRWCSYDYENYLNSTIPSESYSPYGALVEHRAVCTGYARTYVDLLKRIGVQGRVVSSSAMEHSWVIVTIDGENYHVDPCWCDPVFPDGTDGGWAREPSSRYFMKSDEAFANLDHYGWDAGGTVCDDTSLDDHVWPTFSGPVRPYYSFTDLSESWYLPAVEFAMEHGLMTGAGAGTFCPNDPLTRAQAAVVLTRIISPADANLAGQANQTGCSDVDAETWYTGSLNYCVREGIIKGSNDKLRPNDPITREELSTVLLRACYHQTHVIWPWNTNVLPEIERLPEGERPSDWARASVLVMLSQKVIGNGPSLNLRSPVSRAEAAAMIMNAAEMLNIS
ncbi:hypothetical protein B5F74_11415 [Collinsella sp. An271]|uniref:S-layer homology domain-containing protein n=1 Tax=Collinsella sp. An271 TaxID=1965616 RepID=UPI000B377682|nr:S-layer homology domain-containing protein [Collinsella sp. An271]OUO57933.1 hypothetical protein B5F74_11415 [Collinsella sp. An271]